MNKDNILNYKICINNLKYCVNKYEKYTKFLTIYSISLLYNQSKILLLLLYKVLLFLLYKLLYNGPKIIYYSNLLKEIFFSSNILSLLLDILYLELY